MQFQDGERDGAENKELKRKAKPSEEKEKPAAKRPRKKGGVDVTTSNVTFADVGGNEATLKVGFGHMVTFDENHV